MEKLVKLIATVGCQETIKNNVVDLLSLKQQEPLRMFVLKKAFMEQFNSIMLFNIIVIMHPLILVKLVLIIINALEKMAFQHVVET